MDYYAVEDYGSLVHIGTKWYASQYGKAVPVTVVEDSDSPTHWGWLPMGDTTYHMIWHTEVQFRMCFPYGPKIEEEAGKGRICRLLVTKIE